MQRDARSTIPATLIPGDGIGPISSTLQGRLWTPQGAVRVGSAASRLAG